MKLSAQVIWGAMVEAFLLEEVQVQDRMVEANEQMQARNRTRVL